MKFHERLFYAREKRNLTPAEVADTAGIGISTYNHYEAGSSAPKLSIIYNLTKVLDVSLPWLVYEEGEIFATDSPHDGVFVIDRKPESIDDLIKPGLRIRYLRAITGTTIVQLSEMIGVDIAMIVHAETGKRQVSSDLYLRLYLYQGINPEWIRTGKGGMYVPRGGSDNIKVIRDIERKLSR